MENKEQQNKDQQEQGGPSDDDSEVVDDTLNDNLFFDDTGAVALGENPPTLSQVLQLTPQLSPQVIAAYRQHAAQLAAKGKKTRKEQQWEKDYLIHHAELDAILVSMAQDTFKSKRLGFATATGSPTPALSRPSSMRNLNPPSNEYEEIRNDNTPQRIKLNELVRPIEKFDGFKPTPRRWLDEYERAAESNNWNKATMVKYFVTFLEKSALDWYETIAVAKVGRHPEWRDLRAAFIRQYLGDADKQSIRQIIERTHQKDKEPAAVFIPRMVRMFRLADPLKSNEEMVSAVRGKLRAVYQDKLVYYDIYTIEDLNDACRRIEAGLAAAKSASRREFREDKEQGSRGKGRNARYKNGRDANFGKKEEPRRDISQRICYRCERKGHIASKCFSKAKADGSPCNKYEKKDGPKRGKPVNVVQGQEEASPAKKEPEATVKAATGEAQLTTIRPAGRMHLCTIQACSNLLVGCGSLIRHPIRCNNVPVLAIIDTGAYVSVVNPQVVRKHNWPIQASNLALVHAAGDNLKCLGEVLITVEIAINGKVKKITHHFVVIENLCAEALLGIELLRALDINLHLNNKNPISFARQTKKKGVRAIGTRLPPRSINLVTGRVDIDAETVLCTPFGFDNQVMAANSLTTVQNNKVTLVMLNLDNREVMLREGQQIASLQGMDGPNTNPVSDAILGVIQLEDTSETVQVGKDLDAAQVRDLSLLFNELREAFSIDGSLGRTHLVEHHIELEEGARPFAEPMRRHPAIHEREAQRQVEEMLEKGVIEPSNSPWSSEYVIVKKKTGDYRLCIDFRRLNRMTKKNCYPLPNVEACLEALAGNVYYSKIDFASGYWQMPLAPDSKEYTAFRAAGGLWNWKVLPFGLCNAPASFSRLINLMFAGLKGANLQMFLDDVCLATEDWPSHVTLLRQVLTIVIKSNMKLKGSKCLFGAKEITFLGHIVSRDLVRQDPTKMAALTKMPPPTDLNGVRRVLGAFSYYRRFIHNFATIAEPLTRLTRKTEPFKWGDEQEKAFAKLKEEILANATLTHFNPSAETVLKTDASTVGIAGLLLQKHADGWKLVSCCSRRLSQCEANYSTTEIEGLAIVYSVQKFRHYLFGISFKILTDHCALCALKHKLSQNARLRRWAAILSEYDFEIVYTKGSLHQDVDCFSRAPISDEDDELASKLLALPVPVSEDWTLCYTDSEEDRAILEAAEQNEDDYHLENGTIYRNEQIYVPKARREQIMRESHDQGFAGHDGVEGTLERMKYFYWPKLESDLKAYIETCDLCQRRKADRRREAGQYYSFAATHPLELIALDYLGPIPASLSNNVYVLVAIDVFTRYIVARALPDQASATFIKFLNEFCGILGIPTKIVTDNSKAFVNNAVRELTAILRIEHKISAPRHHRGNAVAERAIQSLQEKIALLVKQNSGRLDWENALPLAVLSLNTRVHQTTMKSPYELMFKREHAPVQGAIRVDQETLEGRTVAEAMEGDAFAHTLEAQERAKERFEQQHREQTFEVGEEVLTKRTDRRAKLSDRYEGPYVVEERRRDIYKLRDPSKDKVRYRHVSALRRYHRRPLGMILLIAVLLGGVVLTNAIKPIFHQRLPIFWLRQDEVAVAESSIVQPWEFHFVSPCGIIWRHPHHLSQFSKQNQSPPQHQPPGQDQQINMPPNPNSYQPQTPVASPPQQLPLPPAAPPNAYSGQQGQMAPAPYAPEFQPYNGIEAEFMDDSSRAQNTETGKWLSDREVQDMKANNTRNGRQVQSSIQNHYHHCETVYKNSLLTAVNRFTALTLRGTSTHNFKNVGKPREKRQLLAFGGGIATGVIITNLIDRVEEKLFGPSHSASDEKVDKIAKEARKLNERLDLVQLSWKIQQTYNRKVANNLAQLNNKIDEVVAVEMMTEYLIDNILAYTQHIERLYYSIAERRLDLVTLSQLLGRSSFGVLQVADITDVYMTSPAVGSLKAEIVGQLRAPGTTFNKVVALPYYSEYGKQLKRVEYTGKTYLIHNVTSDCIKGVDSTVNTYIHEDCRIEQFRDESLRKWKKTIVTNLTEEHRHSRSAMAYPEMFISCWGHNITLPFNNKETTTECPKYIFSLPLNISFRTSDRLVSHVAAAQITTKLETPMFDVMDAHFDKFDPVHIELESTLSELDKLARRNEELERNQTAIVIGEERVSWQRTTWTIGWFCVIAFSLVILCYLSKKCRNTKPNFNWILPNSAPPLQEIRLAVRSEMDNRLRQAEYARSRRLSGRSNQLSSTRSPSVIS